MDAPAVQYARSGDVSIAYSVFGDGPVDVVWVPGFVSHGEIAWELPALRRWFARLSSFARVATFDKRGQGMSDRPDRIYTMEDVADDALAVMDAAGMERAALFGISEGGPASVVLAATYPDRISSLILYGTYARIIEAPDYPQGGSLEQVERMREIARAHWGEPFGLRAWAPSVADDERMQAWWAKLLRSGTSLRGFEQLLDTYADMDVRSVLPAINVPALVVSRTGDRLTPPAMGRYLADHIPGARYVEQPGADHIFFLGGDGDGLLDEMEEFLTGARHVPEPDRVLATVLFTDIVGSTKRAAELGDDRWRELLSDHDAVVRGALDRFRGRELKHTGDGFVATFDGPARGIRCATSIADEIRRLGIEIRAGLHTGECERRGDDLAGLAVHIGARVGAHAGAGEVLVSSTVRDLVVGSGIEFDDRGGHELKGVPGEWRLFSVASV